MQSPLPMSLPMDGKGLAFKGVMRARDDDAWRKVIAMGSVWRFPSIGLIMTG